MTYAGLKDKHKGRDIVVAGLGRSVLALADLPRPFPFLLIGVNDIGRLLQPDYLVVVNDRRGFGEERWSHIERGTCPVITHLPNLAVDPARRVVVKLGRYGEARVGRETVDYTNNSPYVGCVVAHWMGASSVGLIGVDFTENHFWGETGRHPLTDRVGTISAEYSRLAAAMQKTGCELFNLSDVSVLTSLPRRELRSFGGLL